MALHPYPPARRCVTLSDCVAVRIVVQFLQSENLLPTLQQPSRARRNSSNIFKTFQSTGFTFFCQGCFMCRNTKGILINCEKRGITCCVCTDAPNVEYQWASINIIISLKSNVMLESVDWGQYGSRVKVIRFFVCENNHHLYLRQFLNAYKAIHKKRHIFVVHKTSTVLPPNFVSPKHSVSPALRALWVFRGWQRWSLHKGALEVHEGSELSFWTRRDPSAEIFSQCYLKKKKITKK